ncbi:MAG TPA: hypothetical protein VI485_08385 [Vicinamibacterales bacterium]|nr:hypothetical protein [Vicinamibacterales bacterium]
MTLARAALTCVSLLAAFPSLLAHAGPPFPIVTGVTRGPYTISIWTDPDATDNGMPGGQFWVVIEASSKGGSIPAGTRATVGIQPIGPPSREVRLKPDTTYPSDVPPKPDTTDPSLKPDTPYPSSANATPVRGDVTNQFAALVLSHEGPYAVRVDVSGPLGAVSVDAMVDATYDLRPAPYMLAWYLAPFVLAGILWTRLLLRRRGLARRSV